MGRPERKRSGLRVELREITEAFPRSLVETILAETDRTGKRRRKLPGYLMVYYVIALGLMVSVSTREVLRRLLAGVRDQGGEGAEMIALRAAICQGRERIVVQHTRGIYLPHGKAVAGRTPKETWLEG